MVLLDFFLSKKKYTATIAKKRLKIMINNQRNFYKEPDYFPQLKNDLIVIMSKYIKTKPQFISVQLEKVNKNILIVELNISNNK